MIAEKIESDRYSTHDEVIAHGLDLIDEQDAVKQMRLEELRREVAIGVEAYERDEYTVYSSAKELMDEIKAESKSKTTVQVTPPTKADVRGIWNYFAQYS